MSMNIAETFGLLFDKNNRMAYKALQELQKEIEKATEGLHFWQDEDDSCYMNDHWEGVINYTLPT